MQLRLRARPHTDLSTMAQPAIPFTCEECGARFDPLGGGICEACGRLLCARHLRGWLRGLLPPLAAGRLVCVACRRAGTAAGGMDRGRAV